MGPLYHQVLFARWGHLQYYLPLSSSSHCSPHHRSLLVLPSVAEDRDHGTRVVVLELLAMLLLQAAILMSTVEGLVRIVQEAPQVPHQ